MSERKQKVVEVLPETDKQFLGYTVAFTLFKGNQ